MTTLTDLETKLDAIGDAMDLMKQILDPANTEEAYNDSLRTTGL